MLSVYANCMFKGKAADSGCFHANVEKKEKISIVT